MYLSNYERIKDLIIDEAIALKAEK